jgi:hypothetical protein
LLLLAYLILLVFLSHIYFFGSSVLLSNSFLLLSLIYGLVLFLYLLILCLFLWIIEVFFSKYVSLFLTILLVIGLYSLNTYFWTPVLDTRIFGMAYVDESGLSVNNILLIFIRQIAVLIILLLINSILINRRDF